MGREYWVQVHSSPIVYRYVDWSITVPLQMIEFNLILKAAGKPTSSGMFWKLLLGTVMMLCFGYLGEIQVINPWLGFIGGMCGWFFILAEIFAGETVFFFAESGSVSSHWKTSLHVGGLVTLVAGVHYMYMREYWVQVHKSPIVYRYVDWSITVPLQMIEFNLILKAAGKATTAAMFWKLLIGTVMMLSFGYLGEIGALLAWPAFAGGMLG